MTTRRRARFPLVALLLAVGMVAAGGATADADPEAPRTHRGEGGTGPPKPLRILVTNDDGVAAPGIDALVEALEGQVRVKVTVIAPADDQSGTGDRTTPGSPDSLTVSQATTASGHRATAVDGFPADTVLYALDRSARKRPHLVISGVNAGQNLGPIADISGTVGAARTAAREGIPALAVSQGIGDPPDFPTGVLEVIAWLEKHRKALAGGPPGRARPAELVSLNVPTCTTGKVRRVIEVPPAATTEGAVGAVDCTSTLRDPPDDIQAFNSGFATLSELVVE
jgi:5'-nucleotidase